MRELPRTLQESPRELMSALADGQADAATATERWVSDPDAREAWHTYHLIGDVLRSEDLAAPSRRDIDFLAGIRERLAAEPPIVAPTPPVAERPPARRSWAAPMAVAAGFAAVAAVVVTVRSLSSAEDTGAVVAAAGAASRAATAVATGPADSGNAPGDPKFQVVDGQLIRDARLDGYLRAHRGTAAAMPGSAIGRFETVVLER